MVAAGVATALTVGVVTMTGSSAAGAAESIHAQSVGRFLDGSAGGMAVQKLADIKDARAKSPGSTSTQNPFDVKLFNQLDIPLTNAINIPTNPAVDAGLANQVANANANGTALGASGAVDNDGGANVGKAGNGAPTLAKVELTPNDLNKIGIPGLPTIPGLPAGLPGAGDFSSLGGLTASLGAVTAIAKTKQGGDATTPHSSLASANLALGSPALGALLSQLKGLSGGGPLDAITGQLNNLLPGGVPALPTGCALTGTNVPNQSLEGGAIVIDINDATVTVDAAKLVKRLLGKDITDLDTSNFDLVSFLVKNLPTILSKGLTSVVTGITDSLQDQFTKCTAALKNVPLLGPVLDALNNVLTTGRNRIVDAIDGLSDQFSDASDGPLGQLADGLKNALDIGLNVQSGPGIQSHDKDYPFVTGLNATPDQATDVVKNQTLVRAVEVQVLNAAPGLPAGGLPGLSSLPGTNSAGATKLTSGAIPAARPLAAAAPGSGALTLAIGNAAAGPSTAVSEPPNTNPPGNNGGGGGGGGNGSSGGSVPTGVPAGQALHQQGTNPPVLLALLALLALTMVGSGAFVYRRRLGLRR